MSDTFLPGSGFDTYEQQDKVLVGLCGGTGCKAAVRILQQQGFAVMGAVVRLCTDDPVVDAAKEAAKALGIECITLNACELASQLAEETAAPPCWRRLTGWASSTLPPATAPGWRPVRTACTSSALPKLRTRVPGLPPCRRKRWAGSSCPWVISAPRMWLRWQQNKKTKEMHPAP